MENHFSLTIYMRMCSHLLRKCLMEKFVFCAVFIKKKRPSSGVKNQESKVEKGKYQNRCSLCVAHILLRDKHDYLLYLSFFVKTIRKISVKFRSHQQLPVFLNEEAHAQLNFKCNILE